MRARLRLGVRDGGAPGDQGGAPPWLGAQERQRWSVLAPSGRADFVASRRLLRELLAAHTGTVPSGWSVSAQSGSAPVAQALDGARPAPVASLSHRLGRVAAATGDAALGRIGVDIECERTPRSAPAGRAAWMLSSPEFEIWTSLPALEQERALLRTWVAKEAWFKASAPGAVPGDFRAIVARRCEPGAANVRVWHGGDLWVALACEDAAALAGADCSAWHATPAQVETSWRLGLAP